MTDKARYVFCEIPASRLAEVARDGLPSGTRVLRRRPRRAAGRLLAIDATHLSLMFSASGCQLHEHARPELIRTVT